MVLSIDKRLNEEFPKLMEYLSGQFGERIASISKKDNNANTETWEIFVDENWNGSFGITYHPKNPEKIQYKVATLSRDILSPEVQQKISPVKDGITLQYNVMTGKRSDRYREMIAFP